MYLKSLKFSLITCMSVSKVFLIHSYFFFLAFSRSNHFCPYLFTLFGCFVKSMISFIIMLMFVKKCHKNVQFILFYSQNSICGDSLDFDLILCCVLVCAFFVWCFLISGYWWSVHTSACIEASLFSNENRCVRFGHFVSHDRN